LDMIGKWVIRTTQEAAEQAHQLVSEFISNANETVEHAMAARDHGSQFARGIRLTYHPDTRRHKERVSERAKNITNMDLVIFQKKEIREITLQCGRQTH
jgi:hypothetical protein